MSRVPSGFELPPGRRSARLLRELLLAEMCEQRLLAWRQRAVMVFVAASVLVFVVARWEEAFAPSTRRAVLGAWVIAATITATFALLVRHAERRRARILERMEPRR